MSAIDSAGTAKPGSQTSFSFSLSSYLDVCKYLHIVEASYLTLPLCTRMKATDALVSRGSVYPLPSSAMPGLKTTVDGEVCQYGVPRRRRLYLTRVLYGMQI